MLLSFLYTFAFSLWPLFFKFFGNLIEEKEKLSAFCKPYLYIIKQVGVCFTGCYMESIGKALLRCGNMLVLKKK